MAPCGGDEPPALPALAPGSICAAYPLLASPPPPLPPSTCFVLSPPASAGGSLPGLSPPHLCTSASWPRPAHAGCRLRGCHGHRSGREPGRCSKSSASARGGDPIPRLPGAREQALLLASAFTSHYVLCGKLWNHRWTGRKIHHSADVGESHPHGSRAHRNRGHAGPCSSLLLLPRQHLPTSLFP